MYIFKALVLGSVSAPTVWGRYAARLGRCTMAISDPATLQMHIFVGDPVYIARGGGHATSLALSRALFWAVVAGFPLAWHKCDGGKTVTWIGAQFSVNCKLVTVTIPEGKITETMKLLRSPRNVITQFSANYCNRQRARCCSSPPSSCTSTICGEFLAGPG